MSAEREQLIMEIMLNFLGKYYNKNFQLMKHVTEKSFTKKNKCNREILKCLKSGILNTLIIQDINDQSHVIL